MKQRLLIVLGFIVLGVITLGLFSLPIWARVNELRGVSKVSLESLFPGDSCITLKEIEGLVPSQYELPDSFVRVFMGRTLVIYKRGSYAWEELKGINFYREQDSECFYTWSWDDPGPAGSSPP